MAAAQGSTTATTPDGAGAAASQASSPATMTDGARMVVQARRCPRRAHRRKARWRCHMHDGGAGELTDGGTTAVRASSLIFSLPILSSGTLNPYHLAHSPLSSPCKDAPTPRDHRRPTIGPRHQDSRCPTPRDDEDHRRRLGTTGQRVSHARQAMQAWRRCRGDQRRQPLPNA
jgi:hypothetical protein